MNSLNRLPHRYNKEEYVGYNKHKKILCFLAVFLLIVIILFISTVYSGRAASQFTLEYLSEKYGQEFRVDKISVGVEDKEKCYRFYCRPVSQSEDDKDTENNCSFIAKYWPKSKRVEDSYAESELSECSDNSP